MLYYAGMFDASMADPAAGGATGARRISRADPSHNPPRGVYGHQVRHNSSGKQSSDGDSEGEEDEEDEEVGEVLRGRTVKKLSMRIWICFCFVF